jgi:hypothetical protein
MGCYGEKTSVLDEPQDRKTTPCRLHTTTTSAGCTLLGNKEPTRHGESNSVEQKLFVVVNHNSYSWRSVHSTTISFIRFTWNLRFSSSRTWEAGGDPLLKVVNIPLLSYFFKTEYLVPRNAKQPYALPNRKILEEYRCRDGLNSNCAKQNRISLCPLYSEREKKSGWYTITP